MAIKYASTREFGIFYRRKPSSSNKTFEILTRQIFLLKYVFVKREHYYIKRHVDMRLVSKQMSASSNFRMQVFSIHPHHNIMDVFYVGK